MEKIIIKYYEKLRWIFLPQKRFYSYYKASSHTGSKLEDFQHKRAGYCYNCGHWIRVKNYLDIPLSLRSIKGAWRKHTH